MRQPKAGRCKPATIGTGNWKGAREDYEKASFALPDDFEILASPQRVEQLCFVGGMSHWVLSFCNVGITIINNPFGNSLYDLCMVIREVV